MAWLNDWNKRQPITIDSTKIDADLTDFPVKVIIPAGNPIFTNSKSDGSDIRFTDSDGTTLLPFEREVHDNAQEIAVYHVKIPLVSSTSDTTFYIYYDNSNATDASNPSAVWDSNYAMVHHMTPTLEDSTANNRDGMNYGSTSGLLNDGYYRIFDGIDDYIDVGNWTLGDIFTIEAYIQPELKDYGDIFGAWFSVTMNTYADGHMYVSVGTGTKWNAVLNPGVGALSSFTDTLVTFRNDNRAGELFINGISRDTKTFTCTPPANTVIYIGARTYPSDTTIYEFKGYIYEFRLSLFARSDTWIKATNYTLYDQLLTIGTEETSQPQPTIVQYLMGVSGSLMKAENKEPSISAYMSNPLEKYTSGSVVSVWEQIVDILSNIENSQFISEDSSTLIENTTLGEIKHYLSMMIEERGITEKEILTLIDSSSELIKTLL